jgi:YidC/Oxa1 family membrane protein insertase
MLGDDNNNEMARQQFRGILVVGAIMMAWFVLFPPAPPVDLPTNPNATSSGEVAPKDGRVATPSTSTETVAPVAATTPSLAWPSLPAIPTDSSAELDDVVIEDEKLRLTFTRIGGRLKQAEVILGVDGELNSKIIPVDPEGSDVDALYPLGLRFDHSDIQDELDYRRFEAKLSEDNRAVIFTLTIPGSMQVVKSFSLTDKEHVLDIGIDYTNLENQSRQLGRDLSPAYTLVWGPGLEDTESGTIFKPSVLWNVDGAVEPEKLYVHKMPEADEGPEIQHTNNLNWIGYRSKYFLSAFQSPNGEFPVNGWISGTEDQVRFGVKTSRFLLESNATHEADYQIYLGQMHIPSLEKASPTLDLALTFFDYPNFLDWFAKLLLRNLNWWYGFVQNYGIAIILLTVLVRLMMFPLTFKSMKSMKAMQTIQPELTELREQYGDDQQVFAQKQMELFRERGVNPLGGCLPMFLQMPIFIALYRMIMYAFEIRGAKFLWIEDLSKPDSLFTIPFMEAIPFIGKHLQNFNVLPLLMVVAMVFSMKLTSSSASQNPQQKIMMRIMPVLFGVISYGFSAGLNLYVLTSTLLGIVQQQIINRSKTVETTPKKPRKSMEEVRKKRKQHFYTRAQEQKRKQSKTSKKKKK